MAVVGPDEIARGEVTLRAGADNQRQVKRAEAAAESRRFLDEMR